MEEMKRITNTKACNDPQESMVYLGWEDMEFDLIGDIYFYNVSEKHFCPTTEITKQMFLYSK